MTTKDYVRIAKIMRDRRPLSARAPQRTGPIEISNVAIDAANDTLDVVSRDLADMLADYNPRFNRATFLSACGVSTDA